jgi:serine/threonine protein kinase
MSLLSVSDQDMQPFMYNNYLFKRIVGRGAYSIVFEVESIQYSTTFAAKVTPIDESQLDKNGEFVDPELSALIALDDPGIIRVYNYFVMNHCLVLILEYCPSGTLLDMINTRRPKREALKDILKKIVKSLYYCHQNSISHRDIKPSNVFIDYYGRPKIADFGLSSFVNKKCHLVNDCCGSKVFAAPEIFKSAPYDAYAADIFALGVTFYQTATGELPWEEDEETRTEITDKQLSRDIHPALASLIRRMTSFDPKKRPTINEILHDSYFAQSASSVNFFETKGLSQTSSFSSHLPSLLKDDNNNNKIKNTYSSAILSIPVGIVPPSPQFIRSGKVKKMNIMMFPRRCRSLSNYDFEQISKLPNLT